MRFLPTASAAPLLVLSLVLSAPAHAAAPMSSERADEQFRAADANGDGVVTRAEFQAHRAGQWPRFDHDGDGWFSRDDLPRFAQGRWDGERLTTLRRQFDRNGDGRIARAEYLSGPTTVFDAADTNRDDAVSQAEVRALAARRREG
jgi:Ca2+-binding EF-hand superfamily protein